MDAKIAPAPQSVPRATIVMTVRERHALTEAAIDSVVRNTRPPFRFIFAETQSPPWLSELLARRQPEWGIEIAKFDAALWPNQIRKRIAPAIATDYVVFLDNDVSVEPGWLERMIACADETGAGIVCPLYLIGDGASVTRIHMAGGRLQRSNGDNGIALTEAHHLMNADLAQAEPHLRREPCDFAEYHCMLISAKLASDGAIFDDRILCVHEHIDTALAARKAGYGVYLEPSARVTYMGYAPFALGELDFFRTRWGPGAGEASIKAFAQKWGVTDDAASFGDVRGFLESHRIEVDPLHPAPAQGAHRSEAMCRDELRQSLSGLFELAVARGYGQEEWNMLERAYRLALIWVNGVYRPCGRPFINHLTGTASVLVNYGFQAQVACAGLLHAAYTHGALPGMDARSAIAEMQKVLAGNPALEKLVRLYTLRAGRCKAILQSAAPQSQLTTEDAKIFAIEAANEADMHLSGEFRFSGRRDLEPPETFELMTYVCRTLGVPGLAQTLLGEREKLSRIPGKPAAGYQGSLRVVDGRFTPASNDAAQIISG